MSEEEVNKIAELVYDMGSDNYSVAWVDLPSRVRTQQRKNVRQVIAAIELSRLQTQDQSDKGGMS